MPGLEGKTLGRYELQTLIGRGGMADVYKGYDPHFEREVAVKVFKREDEEMLRRFIREAHLMAALRNEHLLRIYDSDSSRIGDTTWYYIVMPFMEGGTLRESIRRSPLSLSQACQALKEIALALDYIHQQGIIHRDIKSSNVLLDAKGHCYLADFGIARASTDATQLTSTGNILGTVDYVAPELFEENRRADAGSDLYSLGVLLFEMVTSQLPFWAENQIALVSMHMNKQPPAPRSIVPTLSPQVERVILKALEKKPEQRYDSATALAEAFCRAVNSPEQIGATVRNTSLQQLPGSVASQAGSHKIILPPTQPVASQPSRVSSPPRAAGAVPHNSSRSASVPPTTYAQRQTRPTPPSPPRRRGIILAILALLTLLSLIFLGYFAVTLSGSTHTPPGTTSADTRTAATSNSPTQQPTPTPTPNQMATAQARATATAAAQVQETATVIAQVTATAQAQVSATAGVIQTATAGQATYQDALNNPNNPTTQDAEWDGTDGTDSHCRFQSDGYHVQQELGLVNFRGCHEAAYTYKNATISVDVNMLSGHSGGLFFRLSTDTLGNYDSYLFEIDSQGYYKISWTAGTTSINTLSGHGWTATSALKPGNNVKNTLQVIMRKNTFLFYINGTFLTSATDSTYNSAGQVGFLATTQTSKADIVYSNLYVYPLS
jgi:serine/threonine protein kinase